MDRYKQLMCVKGLIMSLDEQLYQAEQKEDMSVAILGKIVDEYYDSIQDFLEDHEGTK